MPSLKVGNKDLGTTLAQNDKLSLKMDALRLEVLSHGHIYTFPALPAGTATSAPSLPFTEHQKPIVEQDFESKVKVDK